MRARRRSPQVAARSARRAAVALGARRSSCRRWRGGSRCTSGSFPRERLEPRHAASLTVLDAHGEVLRQDATVGGRPRELGAARANLRRTCATRRSPARIAGFWKHAGVDPVGVAPRRLARPAARPRGVRRLDADDAARPAAASRTRARCAASCTRRSSPARHRARAVEARDPRAVPEPRLLRQRRLGRGSRRRGSTSASRRAALSLGEAAFLAVLPRGPEALRSVPPLRARRSRGAGTSSA